MSFSLAILLSCAADSTCVDYPLQDVGPLPYAQLDEASGLAISANEALIWLHNDGPDNALYVVDRAANAVAEVSLLGVKVTDAEDLASAQIEGSQYLVLADIGDNNAIREEISLITLEAPALATGGEPISSVITPTVAYYRYPNGPQDAEALAYDPIDQEFLILTKAANTATLFSVPDDDDLLIEQRLFQSISGVTAMAISPDGYTVVVASHDGALIWQRETDQSVSDLLTTTPCRLPLPTIGMVESVAVTDDGTLLITGEGIFSTLVEAVPDYAQ